LFFFSLECVDGEKVDRDSLRSGEEEAVFVGLVIGDHVVVIEEAHLEEGGVRADAHVPNNDEGDTVGPEGVDSRGVDGEVDDGEDRVIRENGHLTPHNKEGKEGGKHSNDTKTDWNNVEAPVPFLKHT